MTSHIRSSFVLGLSALLCASIGSALPSSTGPPPNDDCSTPELLAGPGTYNFINVNYSISYTRRYRT